MARLTPRRRMWTAVVLLAAITALTVGTWGLREWAPFAHEHAAVTWPKNLQPIVDFVQSESHMEFTSAVDVRFLPTRQEMLTALAPQPRTPAALASLSAYSALGRALGYWSGDVNLDAASSTLRAASDFASGYVRASNTLAIQAKDGAAALTPVQRADIVVSLASILDDQHFHVLQRLDLLSNSQQFEALAGVDYGQMAWLHDRYVHRFDTTDRSAYDAATTKRGTEFEAKASTAPAAFRALRIEAQLLGRGFVAALHALPSDGFAHALGPGVPTALDQLEMPTAKFLRRDTTDPVQPPPLPVHAELLGHRQLGPFGLYLMLANGLPATQALTASDGWGNDAVTIYRAGTQTCADGRVVADTSADADRIERGLNAWGHARPKEAAALVGRKGTTLLFTVCDPGPTVHQATVGPSEIDQFFGRADELTRQVTDHGQPTRSECIAVSAFARFAARDLNPSTLNDVTADCDSSI
jgi:hypothetical protein